MTTEEADRLQAACLYLGQHEFEERLLHAGVDGVELFQSGTADTYQFTFNEEELQQGAFKSAASGDASAAAYGHTPVSAVLNDIAAWLVARSLGFERLVQGVVVTTCSLPNVGFGSLQYWFAADPAGDPSVTGWDQSPDVRNAALFDALIGHQDRHGGNFAYDSATEELGLFDNSYAFALPGHRSNASVIVAQAKSDNPSLDEALLEALNRFQNAEDERGALQAILAPDRWERVVHRATEMRTRNEFLDPLEF